MGRETWELTFAAENARIFCYCTVDDQIMTRRDDPFSALIPAPNDHGPLYSLLGARLRTLISDGELRRGDAVPSERDLAELTGLSRVTIRRALADLVKEGLLYQKPGVGTFVAGRIEQPLSILMSFSEDMRLRGYQPGSVWLSKTACRASPVEAMALGVAPGAPVLRLKRIRTADGQPLAIETAVIAQDFLPDTELVGDSFYAALKARDLIPIRALQCIRARIAAPTEQDLLGLGGADAVLEIRRQSYLADGRVLEVTFSSYRADQYDFVVELRTASGNG